MWQHNYLPVGDSLALSSLVAAIPIFTLLIMLAVVRKAAWISALTGLAAAVAVALFAYRMPVPLVVSTVFFGAAQGLFPIGWVVFTAVLLYNITVKTGKFEVVKNSIGSLTDDRRLQALLIAFAFGAFIEGAAGFGTPVAVSAAMLTGLGFSSFYAGGICLLANTAPVAFGSIGIPVLTLQRVTGLPLQSLSAGVGRICAPISLIIPAYLVLVMGGWKALRGVLPAAIVCGVAFSGTQFLVSNFLGPELVDILASLAALGGLVIMLKVWKPKDEFHFPGDGPIPVRPHVSVGETLLAWSPFILLVVCVLVWSPFVLKPVLSKQNVIINWPGLHNLVQTTAPVSATAAPYGARYTFEWLSAAGTACLLAAILSAVVLRMSATTFFGVLGSTVRQLVFAELTIGTVLGLAILMNYSGATGTLGMAFAGTGAIFPFFSALLGWLGVFLTGSDTSANALFGNLQVVTANQLHMNPILMASANSSGGVMGKMISLQSVAVASAATAMTSADESKLFRFTLRHSVFLACMIGLVVMFYAYVMPGWAP
ncbi:MAG: L-lactate transport [Bryobacterales bacterium]|nr:L-lactate transport [Bryobacterales bacterium]